MAQYIKNLQVRAIGFGQRPSVTGNTGIPNQYGAGNRAAQQRKRAFAQCMPNATVQCTKGPPMFQKIGAVHVEHNSAVHERSDNAQSIGHVADPTSKLAIAGLLATILSCTADVTSHNSTLRTARLCIATTHSACCHVAQQHGETSRSMRIICYRIPDWLSCLTNRQVMTVSDEGRKHWAWSAHQKRAASCLLGCPARPTGK